MITNNYLYQVTSQQQLSSTVINLTLRPEQQDPLPFMAGQYLILEPKTIEARPFSIANRPNQQNILELHIRHVPENIYTTALFNEIEHNKTIKVSGPYGKCVYPTTNNDPIIMLAGSTGFAPMKAIIEQALLSAPQRELYLCWYLSSDKELYFDANLQQLQNKHANFHYYPLGSIEELIKQNFSDLQKLHVFAAGPQDLITTTLDLLTNRGLPRERFYFDTL